MRDTLIKNAFPPRVSFKRYVICEDDMLFKASLFTFPVTDTINELPEIQPFTFLLYNLSRCVPKQVIHEIMTRQHIELWITQSKMDHIMHSRNPTIEFIKHLEKRRRITRRDVSLLKTLFKDLLVALVYLNQYETEIQKSKLHEGKFGCIMHRCFSFNF